MPPVDHPAELSPDERRHELARILAAGLLRLRSRPRLAEPPYAPPKNLAPGLEVPRKTVLSVHPG